MTTVALGLIAYMVLLATVLHRPLAGARWAGRMPRLALLVWTAAILSLLTAFAVTTLLLSLPARTVWQGIGSLVRVCMDLVRATYCPTSLPGPVGTIALTLLGAVATWGAVLAVRQRWCTSKWRRGHRRRLDLLTTDADGVTVVPHRAPMVYTVPGRRARLVMTTAATNRLNPQQRAAALAHEHAHLDGKHSLLVGFARLLERAFPGVPLLRAAREQICLLVEMAADDCAAARHGRAALLGAITTVAAVPPREGVLAASGADTVARASRQLSPVRPVPSAVPATVGAFAVLLPLLPILAVVLPVATGGVMP